MKLACFAPRKLSIPKSSCKRPALQRSGLGLIDSKHFHYVVLLSTVFGLYLQTVSADFVFDDREAILRNPDAKWNGLSWETFWQPFRNDFWGTPLKSNASHKSYRPITVWSFRLNHLFSSSPWSYHLTNVALYALLVLQVYRLFASILRNAVLAFIGALLFSLHPVHVEAVASVVGRAELLAGLFYLVALEVYFTKRDSYSSLYLCVPMLAFLAMLCKEVGLTALGVVLLVELVTNSGQASRPSKKWLVFAVTAIGALLFRGAVMGFEPPHFAPEDNPQAFVRGIWKPVNLLYIYLLNAFTLLCPVWLCYDWSMGCVPTIQAVSDLRFPLTALLTLAGLVTLAKMLCTRDRVVLIGLALTLVPFLPAANIFYKVGFVLAERVLFLPSLGYSLLVIFGWDRLKQIHGPLADKALYAVLFVYAARSSERIRDWKTELTLYKSGLEVCPGNAKVQYNYASVLADSGNKVDAERFYREALRLWPNYAHAMNNLGNLLKNQGRLAEAEQLLSLAVANSGDYATAWMNLGIAQSALKKYTHAERSYNQALRLRPNYADCFYNMGNMYVDLGQSAQAMQYWRNATLLNPRNAKAWTNMVVLADNLGDLNLAIRLGREALGRGADSVALRAALGRVLGLAGHYVEARSHLLLAVDADPTCLDCWVNLGVVYHKQKQYGLAEAAYSRVLDMNPKHASASTNILRLRRTMHGGA